MDRKQIETEITNFILATADKNILYWIWTRFFQINTNIIAAIIIQLLAFSASAWIFWKAPVRQADSGFHGLAVLLFFWTCIRYFGIVTFGNYVVRSIEFAINDPTHGNIKKYPSHFLVFSPFTIVGDIFSGTLMCYIVGDIVKYIYGRKRKGNEAIDELHRPKITRVFLIISLLLASIVCFLLCLPSHDLCTYKVTMYQMLLLVAGIVIMDIFHGTSIFIPLYRCF